MSVVIILPRKILGNMFYLDCRMLSNVEAFLHVLKQDLHMYKVGESS